LGAENRNLFDVELAALIDNGETFEGLVIRTVNSADDFLVIQQHYHFAVVAATPLNGVWSAVVEDYSLINPINDRRTV
jgi:hypothetical protein